MATNKTNRYSPETKAQAVSLVLEAHKNSSSLWSSIESIAPKIGCSALTLYEWVKRYETDIGLRNGVTTAERGRIKALEREVRELKKANEILRLASFFSQTGHDDSKK